MDDPGIGRLMDCIRRAWLAMGGATLPLEDDDAGYYCTELDLGYPDVRDVTNDRPDMDGIDDRTRFFGARAVSAKIAATDRGTMTPDQIGALFAPYMLPSRRPELHYVLERPGNPERFTTLRASGYGWPISGGVRREIALGWVASDPVMRDPATNSANAYAGSSTVAGRTYPTPLPYARTYPTGGMAPSTGQISSPGDVNVRPLLRIYGPITAPVVTLQASSGTDPAITYTVAFLAAFVIGSGDWVDFDAFARTVYYRGDPAQPILNEVDWQRTLWPELPPEPWLTTMTLAGSSTTAVSQVIAYWHDGYLT